MYIERSIPFFDVLGAGQRFPKVVNPKPRLPPFPRETHRLSRHQQTRSKFLTRAIAYQERSLHCAGNGVTCPCTELDAFSPNKTDDEGYTSRYLSALASALYSLAYRAARRERRESIPGLPSSRCSTPQPTSSGTYVPTAVHTDTPLAEPTTFRGRARSFGLVDGALVLWGGYGGGLL
jgi:hypothetical protein